MPDWLLPLLTVVLGGGGMVTAIATWRRDAEKGPVEAQTAQVADAVALSNAAAGWVKIADERQAKLNEKVDVLVEELEDLRQAVSSWGFWYSDLTFRWPYHRLQEQPPPPPVSGGRP